MLFVGAVIGFYVLRDYPYVFGQHLRHYYAIEFKAWAILALVLTYLIGANSSSVGYTVRAPSSFGRKMVGALIILLVLNSCYLMSESDDVSPLVRDRGHNDFVRLEIGPDKARSHFYARACVEAYPRQSCAGTLFYIDRDYSEPGVSYSDWVRLVSCEVQEIDPVQDDSPFISLLRNSSGASAVGCTLLMRCVQSRAGDLLELSVHRPEEFDSIHRMIKSRFHRSSGGFTKSQRDCSFRDPISLDLR